MEKIRLDYLESMPGTFCVYNIYDYYNIKKKNHKQVAFSVTVDTCNNTLKYINLKGIQSRGKRTDKCLKEITDLSGNTNCK